MNTISNTMVRLSLLIAFFFMSLVSIAQEKSADVKVDINTNKGSNWYAQPWVWVIGGAVFVLLLVALLRGGNREKSGA